MTWKIVKDLIWDDLCRTTDHPSKIAALKLMITNASFKMSFWFRIGSWLESRKKWRMAYYMVFIYYKHLMYKTGIQLPIGTQVGGGHKILSFW